jgi:hypothetical protein
MAALSKAAAHERARIAGLKRAVRNGERPPNDPALKEAERNYCAARMADYAKRLVATWPPMSDEQIETVANILRSTRGGAADA